MNLDSKIPSYCRVAFSLPMHLIQSFRLYHSLMESDFNICISPDQEQNFVYLAQYFEIHYSLKTGDCPVLPDVTLSHEKPTTRIGDLERRLIFPHGIVKRCREKWSAVRPVCFAFCGLLTDKRKAILEQWSRSMDCEIPAQVYPLDHIGKAPQIPVEPVELYLWASKRGRRFPVKVWDDAYYELLAGSQFVICPNGDFVWTYRFLEAVLCGAIPVVEESCDLYEGFEYHRMGDAKGSMKWSFEIAERNYTRAVQMLTIPKDDINRALMTELSKFNLVHQKVRA